MALKNGGKREGSGRKKLIDKPEATSAFLSKLSRIQGLGDLVLERLEIIVKDPATSNKEFLTASSIILDRAIPKGVAEELFRRELPCPVADDAEPAGFTIQ